jgi:hypothetical protein
MSIDPQGHWDYQLKPQRITLASVDERIIYLENLVGCLNQAIEDLQAEVFKK